MNFMEKYFSILGSTYYWISLTTVLNSLNGLRANNFLYDG